MLKKSFAQSIVVLTEGKERRGEEGDEEENEEGEEEIDLTKNHYADKLSLNSFNARLPFPT